jgi:3-hydroxyisobutyrate dehydrogenase
VPAPPDRVHAAWLGTGLLGTAFAERLLGRGLPVSVWNRNPARCAPLVALGARAASDAVDALAGVHVVHLCLTDDNAVDSVLASLQGHLSGITVVDHSTTAPAPTARRAERLAEEGVGFLHAPVFMAPDNARAATGLMLVSGPDDAFAAWRGHLSAMTGTLRHLGARPDLAAAYKLMGNAMVMAVVGGLADVMTLGRATGVEPADALGLFRDFRVEKQFEGRGVRMAAGNFAPTFDVATARKDIRLMLETAAHAPDLPLGVLPALADRMDALIAQGKGNLDLGALALDVFGPAASRGRRRSP